MRLIILTLVLPLFFVSPLRAFADPTADLVTEVCHDGAARIDVVRALLAQGADVNGQDRQGISVLACAAINMDYDVAVLLLQKGADVNSRDIANSTPLLDAAASDYWGSIDTMKLFLEHGALVEARDKWGTTALIASVQSGVRTLEKAQLMIETYHADVNAQETVDRPTHMFGDTALSAAANIVGGSDLVKYLLSKGAKTVPQNGLGETALIRAVNAVDDDSVAALLVAPDAAAALNLQTSEGKTALMTAVRVGDSYIENTQAILAAPGIQLNLRDKDGKTALGIALEFVAGGSQIHQKSIALLRAAGATE
jgi:ankyrin repeat protein